MTPQPYTPTPLTPDPLTPAQQRARRVQQRAFITQEQAARHLPVPAAVSAVRQWAPTLPARRAAGAPATKRFQTHELRRVPVEVTPAARAVIDSSSDQGRLLPQAFAEVFGTHPHIVRARIDLVAKRAHFPLHPSEIHPVTGAEPHLLVITARHPAHPDTPDYRWFVNAADLTSMHPRTHEVTFNAAKLAQELLRFYPHGAHREEE